VTVQRTVISLRVLGGLGNQLFELAAALHLRDVIGVPVVLDRQFYFEEQPSMDHRELEIDQLPHGFKVIRGRGQSTRLRALPRALHQRVLTRGAPVRLYNEIVAEFRSATDPDETAKAVLELDDQQAPFFQSALAPQTTATQMRRLLETRIPLAFSPETESPYIGVHSRLGDYLNEQWRGTLGAIDPATLLELGRELSRKHDDLPIRVFTDSPEIFRSLCPAATMGPYELSNAISPWDALTEMARSHAFVMSNSTLSWWAAFLATISRESAVDVLMPYPWYPEPGPHDRLLSMPGWARFERSLLPESADLSGFGY
jgi:hypothetical protein